MEQHFLSIYLRNYPKPEIVAPHAQRKLIAEWAARFTPFVGVSDELGVMLEVTGTEKMHGGYSALARRIYAPLQKKGFVVRLALAPTIGSAWALARYSGKHFSTVPEKTALPDHLASLPVEALRIDLDAADSLHELGISTLSALRQLPRKELAERFGIPLIRTLDRCFGDVPELLPLLKQEERLLIEEEFDPPLLDRKQIIQGALLVFRALLSHAEKLHRSPHIFHFTLSGVDRLYQPFTREKQLSLHTATREHSHIEEILTPLIERLTFPGNVHTITLAVTDEASTQAKQIDTEKSWAADEKSLQEVLNTLSLQLGEKALRTFSFQESRLPERSFFYTPLQKGALAAEEQAAQSPVSLHAYPPYILPRPESIDALALLPDYPPVRIHWRGKEYRITQSQGPERIAVEWWDVTLADEEIEQREYFRLQDHTGRWLWAYRTHPELKWFIQGLWT